MRAVIGEEWEARESRECGGNDSYTAEGGEAQVRKDGMRQLVTKQTLVDAMAEQVDAEISTPSKSKLPPNPA